MARPTVKRNDPYVAKLVKYIPTEVVMAYVAASGFIATADSHKVMWFCIVSITLLVLTPLYLFRSTRSSENCYKHCVAGTLAFAAWVFATGGPFEHFGPPASPNGWYRRAIGSVVLILVCLSLPLVDGLVPERKRA
jgi:hypothetical protein